MIFKSMIDLNDLLFMGILAWSRSPWWDFRHPEFLPLALGGHKVFSLGGPDGLPGLVLVLAGAVLHPVLLVRRLVFPEVISKMTLAGTFRTLTRKTYMSLSDGLLLAAAGMSRQKVFFLVRKLIFLIAKAALIN